MTAEERGPESESSESRPLSKHAEAIRKSVHNYRADHDPEHIHQIRVSTRRARAALSCAPDDDATSRLKAGVKALADSLGQTRDADVIGGLINGQVDMHLPHLRSELEPLLSEIARDSEEFREVALRRFRSPYLNVLLTDMRKYEPSGVIEETPAQDPVQLLEKRWRQLRRANRDRKQDSSPQNLHRMRVAAKKLRYTVEMQSELDGPETRKLVKPVRRLQNLLGEIHDLHMAAERVEAVIEIGRNLWSPESIAAGEQLLYILHRRADRMARKVGKAYRRARRRKRRISAPDEVTAST